MKKNNNKLRWEISKINKNRNNKKKKKIFHKNRKMKTQPKKATSQP